MVIWKIVSCGGTHQSEEPLVVFKSSKKNNKLHCKAPGNFIRSFKTAWPSAVQLFCSILKFPVQFTLGQSHTSCTTLIGPHNKMLNTGWLTFSPGPGGLKSNVKLLARLYLRAVSFGHVGIRPFAFLSYRPPSADTLVWVSLCILLSPLVRALRLDYGLFLT